MSVKINVKTMGPLIGRYKVNMFCHRRYQCVKGNEIVLRLSEIEVHFTGR